MTFEIDIEDRELGVSGLSAPTPICSVNLGWPRPFSGSPRVKNTGHQEPVPQESLEFSRLPSLTVPRPYPGRQPKERRRLPVRHEGAVGEGGCSPQTFWPVLRAACLRIRKETPDKHLKHFGLLPSCSSEEKTKLQASLAEDPHPAEPSPSERQLPGPFIPQAL